MLETPHIALGAAIATKIPNPLISIPLAFASHFVLEIVPHWNPHINTETKKFGKPTKKSTIIIVVDSALALTLGTYIAFSSNNPYTILAASFASVLPDLIEAPYFFLGWRHKFLKFWLKFQKSLQVDTNFFWGMINQILVILSCLYWIFT